MRALGPIVARPAKPLGPLVLAACFAILYCGFAVIRHRTYRSGGYDLGIFDQAVRSYAQGRLPVSTIRDPNLMLLGDHFHPILAVLAPAYRLVPAPETLLVAQGLLLAASVFAIARLGCSVLGPRTGLVLGTCYGFSWGLLNVITFDFHEIAFAVPLIAFALEAYLAGRPGRAVAIASVLVLVKEDLGLTLAALGVLLALRPATRRLGLLTAAGGTVASLLCVLVIVPGFSADGNYRYLGGNGVRPTEQLITGQVFDPGKLHLVLLLLLPTLFLALRSPLSLLLVPTLAWRLGGTNLLYWTPTFHYDAVLMPVLFCALIHSLVLLRPWLAGRSRRWVRRAITVALAATCASLFVQSSFSEGPGRRPEWAGSAERLMSLIPDGASVSTTDQLAPHLSSRTDVYLLKAGQRTEYTLVFADTGSYPGTPTRDGRLLLIRNPAAALPGGR